MKDAYRKGNGDRQEGQLKGPKANGKVPPCSCTGILAWVPSLA